MLPVMLSRRLYNRLVKLYTTQVFYVCAVVSNAVSKNLPYVLYNAENVLLYTHCCCSHLYDSLMKAIYCKVVEIPFFFPIYMASETCD